MLLQILSLCVLLASAETLHGIVRAAVLVPRIGKARALKVSIVTGSLLALAICYWRVPALALESSDALVLLGLGLALFMAAFDVTLARGVLHLPWAKVARDFNPATGNYLSIGLGLLLFMPWLVMQLR